MKPSIDMLRVLYLVNLYQPVTLRYLSSAYLGSGRTKKTLFAALSNLKSEQYIAADEPFFCSPKGLAALQSVQLYKARDAGRLFHLKLVADSYKFESDERQEIE